MFEKFIEPKPIGAKEMTVKDIAREMLGRFRAKFGKTKKVERAEEPTRAPKPAIPERVEVADKKTRSSYPPESFEPEIVKPVKKEREKKTDRGTYESVTTNDYFEGWDEDVELEGNPEIKEQIRQNIIKAEKTNQGRYEQAAADLGVPVEEFKNRLQAKVEDMVKRANFFRATQVDVLGKIMNIDGRWKSQFETNTSGGSLNPHFRAASEMEMFGFNKNTVSEIRGGTRGEYLPEEAIAKDKEKRPIYGYFSDEEHGAINNQGKIPPPTNVLQYGTVNFKIKKERALEKATLTFHDSLGEGRGSEWPPTPAAKPHFTSFRFTYQSGRVLNELKGPSVVNWGESYTEVQYHGQLTIDDVESIHVSRNNGLYPEDMEQVRMIFNEYKEQHPESTIQLIEF